LRAGAGLLAGALLVLGLVVGGAGGVYLEQAHPDWIPLFAGTGANGQLNRAALDQAITTIETQYYNSHLNYSKLSDQTIAGLVSGLQDPFSAYLTPAEFQSTQRSYAGQYTGIGVYVSFHGQYPEITGLIPGSPAEKVGVKAGDQLLSVDGKSLKGLSPDLASAAIQGPAGSVAHLLVQRGGGTLTLNVRRASITAPFVLGTTLEGDILYARIFSFGTGTADQLVALLQKNLAGKKGVVLDLRGNPGGFIDAAQAVIGAFVSSGEAFELRDRSGQVEHDGVTGTHVAPSIPLVVLVDKDSASASEIVAGSLQVHHRAKLVGTTTFGKGSVQEDFPLSNGGDLHLTIKHWFLPDGATVQGKGLTPDDPVALANPDFEFQVSDAAAGFANDTQLQAALKLLGA
jgi:carboxyl-terminal processing protease